MDFANRGNETLQDSQQPTRTSLNNGQASRTFQPVKKQDKKKKRFDFAKASSIFMLFAGALLIIAIIVGVAFGTSGGNKEKDLIQGSKYQAVFLSSQDGQVYFGKLSIYNNNIYRLTDIYYVRVDNPIQPEGAKQKKQPNISLAKLGNELHGPQDAMYIARNKVLYWENLKNDGKVVTAITEFKKNGNKPAQQQNKKSTPASLPTTKKPTTP